MSQQRPSLTGRFRPQFQLRTLLVVSAWLPAVMYCAIYRPLGALAMVGIPSLILAVRFARQGRVGAALIMLAMLLYFAVSLWVIRTSP